MSSVPVSRSFAQFRGPSFARFRAVSRFEHPHQWQNIHSTARLRTYSLTQQDFTKQPSGYGPTPTVRADQDSRIQNNLHSIGL
jgi:hypothetical protein